MPVTPNDQEAWLTLQLLPGLGPTLATRLLQAAGSPAAILQGGGGRHRIPGLPRQLHRLLGNREQLAEYRNQARRLLERLEEGGIHLCTRDDPAFPQQLLRIPDPPLCLYCQGAPGCLQDHCVAIVGARSATPYGRRIAYQLGKDLARQGITVVSGVALGIDAQAHQGALAAGGPTAGVLGCGLDVVYPRGHAPLYEAIRDQGVLLSEYPPGTPPAGHHFPARNRLISGLAAGVVVVEATRRSGSLITAQLALDQGREVFAVPGRIDSTKSEGPHRLLQQGAYLVHCSRDITDALAFRHQAPESPSPTVHPPELGPDETRMLQAISTYPVDIDTLIQTSGFTPAQAARLLLTLELQGCIRQLPGQQYERTGLG